MIQELARTGEKRCGSQDQIESMFKSNEGAFHTENWGKRETGAHSLANKPQALKGASVSEKSAHTVCAAE